MALGQQFQGVRRTAAEITDRLRVEDEKEIRQYDSSGQI